MADAAAGAVIVYLMTLLVAGSVAGRAVVQDVPDCRALAQRIVVNDHTLTGKRYEVACEPLPMYFGLVEPPKP